MKRLSLLLLACFFTSFLFAGDGIGLSKQYQKDKKRTWKFDKNRLFVGGGLGGGSLQGGYIFSITPSIGYMFTDRFHAGINLGYFYSKFKEPYDITGNSYYQEKNRVVSTAVFARFFPIDVVFLQVNPELNFGKLKTEQNFVGSPISRDEINYNIPAFLVGGGYAQRLGGNSYMMISVMYDLVQNPNSPYYRQPVFGGGLALGLFGGR